MYFTIFKYPKSIRSNLQFIESMERCLETDLFWLKIKSPCKYLTYIWSCIFVRLVIVKKHFVLGLFKIFELSESFNPYFLFFHLIRVYCYNYSMQELY